MIKTVLVVDDVASYREMMAFALSGYGFRPLVAADGTEALAILEKEKVDLVVTDMKMPNMDGLDVAVALKKKYPKLPIIFMTAYGMEERFQEALRFADHYLLKPFDISELNNLASDVDAKPDAASSAEPEDEAGGSPGKPRH
jgi:CheY-like chemotaxis protein